jgi:hypothetical protein
MGRSFWLVAALVVAAWLGVAAAAPARSPDGPENLTLRLGDLSPGYLVGDDSGCGLTLIGEGSPPALSGLRRHRHHGCVSQFEQLWVAPGTPAGPRLVESAAFRFAEEPGAEAGFRAARAVAAFVFGVRTGSLEPRPARVAIGKETMVFSTDDALVEGRARRPGIVVLWRSGRVLSLLFTGGEAGPAAEQAALALALALVQQARVQTPTPLGPRENDDREVPLDNPRLGIDVYWLGSRFKPSGRLPALKLSASYGPLGRTNGPGWRAELDYGARGAGVKLGLWRPRVFARFRRSRLGRLVRTQRCARGTRLDVPGGRAVIYAGHLRPPRRCGERPRDRYLAHVFLNGVVVTVDVPFCFCPLVGSGRDPYNTLRGMRAIVRNLEPRPPPYASASVRRASKERSSAIRRADNPVARW